MSVKAIVAKVTASGEQVNFEVTGARVDDVGDKLVGVLRLADARLWEMNQRILKGNAALKELAKESPKGYMLFQQAMAAIFGQEVPEHAVATAEQERAGGEAIQQEVAEQVTV